MGICKVKVMQSNGHATRQRLYQVKITQGKGHTRLRSYEIKVVRGKGHTRFKVLKGKGHTR